MITLNYLSKKLISILSLPKLIKKSREAQVARLLNLLGPDSLKLYNLFKIDDMSVKKLLNSLNNIVLSFNAIFLPV